MHASGLQPFNNNNLMLMHGGDATYNNEDLVLLDIDEQKVNVVL